MEKNVLLYFFVAIFCISAGRTLLPHPPQDDIRKPTTNASGKSSPLNVVLEDSSNQLTFSASMGNSYLDFLLYFPEEEKEEKEETEDDVTKTADHQQQSLHRGYGSVMLINFLRQSYSVSSIPLFILLHSWKHFLR